MRKNDLKSLDKMLKKGNGFETPIEMMYFRKAPDTKKVLDVMESYDIPIETALCWEDWDYHPEFVGAFAIDGGKGIYLRGLRVDGMNTLGMDYSRGAGMKMLFNGFDMPDGIDAVLSIDGPMENKKRVRQTADFLKKEFSEYLVRPENGFSRFSYLNGK